MADLKLISVNVQGLSKKKQLKKKIYNKNIDILCVQDTHISKTNSPIYTCFSSTTRGVGIFINTNNDFKVKNEIKSDDGNLAALDMNIEDNHITLICIYGPNEDNPVF